MTRCQDRRFGGNSIVATPRLLAVVVATWFCVVDVALAAAPGDSHVGGRRAIRSYTTATHVGKRPQEKRSDGSSMFVVERSNGGASIDDLKTGAQPDQSLDVEILPPAPMPEPPELPLPIRPQEIESVPETEMVETYSNDPSDWPIPSQVYETRIPTLDDGLAGNRQVALTPFPNLDIQSGPLAAHQLPWSHRFHETKPFTVATTMEFQTLVGTLRNNGSSAQQQYGWYNSFLFSVPFWKEKGVGVQFAATAEPTTEPQLLTEFGFAAFRRALWGNDPSERLRLMDRLSWGIGFDGIWDTEHRVFVGQQRMQFAYSVAPNRELGVWGSFSLGEELSTSTDPPLDFATANNVSFYYRHVFPSELDGTIFVGAVENPGGFMFGGYLSYRLSARTAWVLQGMNNFGEDGGNSVYTGIRVYFSPLVDSTEISGSPMNRYRSFLRPPDHINLQLRQTSP